MVLKISIHFWNGGLYKQSETCIFTIAQISLVILFGLLL